MAELQTEMATVDTALDCLRIVASIMVVIWHSAYEVMKGWPSSFIRAITSQYYRTLTYWHTPIYLMISGYYLLDPSRDYPLSKLYLKNIRHLFSVYLFWNCVYVLQLHYMVGLSYDTLLGWFNGAESRCYYHLWYLPLTIRMYSITPVLRTVCENIHLCRYYLAVWFLRIVLLPNISELVSSPYVSYTQKFLEPISPYSGYFVMGYYLGHTTISRAWSIIIFSLGIMGCIYTLGM